MTRDAPITRLLSVQKGLTPYQMQQVLIELIRRNPEIDELAGTIILEMFPKSK